MIGKARVTGDVMSAKGAPLNNQNVIAYSFDDGSSGTKIGESKTNAKGAYVIDYKLQDRSASAIKGSEFLKSKYTNEHDKQT